MSYVKINNFSEENLMGDLYIPEKKFFLSIVKNCEQGIKVKIALNKETICWIREKHLRLVFNVSHVFFIQTKASTKLLSLNKSESS